jgi:hypothetical protein
VAWSLSDRASGHVWRVGDSDLAWEIEGYDLTRFELHVLDEEVVGAPDGRPDSASDDRPAQGSQWRSFRQRVLQLQSCSWVRRLPPLHPRSELRS